MGFDQESAGQPLVNVHKRTTKVNFAVALGVVVFLLISLGVVIWAARKESRGEPVLPPPAVKK